MKRRIPLSPGFHAEPGETPGHQHDVYTTEGLPDGQRIHVGQLSAAAVAAWAGAFTQAMADVHADLDELCTVLGLPRAPQSRSPHAVFQECLRVVRERLGEERACA